MEDAQKKMRDVDINHIVNSKLSRGQLFRSDNPDHL